MIFLPYIQSKSTPFQFKHITLCPVYTDNYKKNNNIKKKKKVFLISSLDLLEGSNNMCLEPSLLLVEQPQYSQSFFVEELFHLFDHFHGLPL